MEVDGKRKRKGGGEAGVERKKVEERNREMRRNGNQCVTQKYGVDGRRKEDGRQVRVTWKGKKRCGRKGGGAWERRVGKVEQKGIGAVGNIG